MNHLIKLISYLSYNSNLNNMVKLKKKYSLFNSMIFNLFLLYLVKISLWQGINKFLVNPFTKILSYKILPNKWKLYFRALLISGLYSSLARKISNLLKANYILKSSWAVRRRKFLFLWHKINLLILSTFKNYKRFQRNISKSPNIFKDNLS